MYRIGPILAVACSLVAATEEAKGEDLSYAISWIKSTSDATPIATGTRTYTVANVRSVETRTHQGTPTWEKSIELTPDFTLTIFQRLGAEEISWFGVSIKCQRYPRCWGWNQFEIGDDGEFAQHIGSTRVSVSVRVINGLKEIQKIEFPEDTTLLFTDDTLAHPPGTSTFKVLLRKGSVLRIAP